MDPGDDRRRWVWKAAEPDLVAHTPERARDLIVDCFFQSQRETFRRTKKRLGGTRLDDASIRSDIVGVVRVAFAETGGVFDHPTAESLRLVVAFLARNAEAWGTPPDVIAQHARQIGTMLDRLGSAAAARPA